MSPEELRRIRTDRPCWVSPLGMSLRPFVQSHFHTAVHAPSNGSADIEFSLNVGVFISEGAHVR